MPHHSYLGFVILIYVIWIAYHPKFIFISVLLIVFNLREEIISKHLIKKNIFLLFSILKNIFIILKVHFLKEFNNILLTYNLNKQNNPQNNKCYNK